MKIAGIDLGDKPLFLAPMEDVTDPSFRYVCKMFGADMVYTEFISCDGLIRDAAQDGGQAPSVRLRAAGRHSALRPSDRTDGRGGRVAEAADPT